MLPEERTADIRKSEARTETLWSGDSRYRALVEANAIGYALLSPDLLILDANKHYVSFTGHKDLKDILGRNIADLVVPELRQECIEAIKCCISKGSIKNVTLKHPDQNGGSTDVLINAATERFAGMTRVLVLGSDITEHTQEAALWRREQLFTDAVFASAPFLLFEYDDQLHLIRWNKRAETITGYSATELANKSLLDWFDEATLMRIFDVLKNVRLNGHANVEANIKMKSDVQIPHHFTMVRLLIDKRETFICIGVDISALKQVEQELRDSEVRLRKLIEEAAIPIVISREGLMIYANAKYLSLLGYTNTDQLMGLPILERFAPQCREQIGDFIRRKEQGTPAPNEYEAIGLRLDGTEVPVIVGVTNIQLADGPVNLTCLTDISARKTAEETISAERDKAKRYLQVAEVILLALDAEGTVTLINRKGRQILGYEEAELLGKNWFSLCIPRDEYDRVFGNFREGMAGEKGSYEYQENSVQTKDGSKRLVAWHNSFVSDDSGAVIGTLSSGEDITDRRHAEEELASAHRDLTAERETLSQKNIALQELLHQFGESKQILGTHIQANIDKIVLPNLDRLPAKLDSQGKHFLSVARNNLGDIVSPFISRLDSMNRKLTQREVELCDLIRRGHGTKEIAQLRGTSVFTVTKQRKIIRQKLGITGTDVNLASFLTEMHPTTNVSFPTDKTDPVRDIGF